SFLYESDDVDVSDESSTATSYQAQLTAHPDALPQVVWLHIYSPVSLKQLGVNALEIGCAYEWHLALASGESLVVTTHNQKPGATVDGDGQWSKAGAALGKSILRVSGNAFESFNFER